MQNEPENTSPVAPEARRIFDVMKPGRAYQPARVAERIGMTTSTVRELMERMVIAGELEQGWFHNSKGNRQPCFFRPDKNAPFGCYDEARRAVEVCASDVLEAMQPGVGKRVHEIAKLHMIPLHRATTLLSILVREKLAVKRATGNAHRRHDMYYIAGTEPGAKELTASSRTAQSFVDQPTFDAEYGRTLRSLGDICKTGRGRS